MGDRAALPHARPTDRVVGEADFTLIDWGAVAGGYASDLTRVLVTGRISPKLERVYGVVLTAQQRAIEAIRPGVTISEVDNVARSLGNTIVQMFADIAARNIMTGLLGGFAQPTRDDPTGMRTGGGLFGNIFSSFFGGMIGGAGSRGGGGAPKKT